MTTLNIDTLEPQQLLDMVQAAKQEVWKRVKESEKAEELLEEATYHHDKMLPQARAAAREKAAAEMAEGKEPMAGDIDAHYRAEMAQATATLKRAIAHEQGARARLREVGALLHPVTKQFQILIMEVMESRRPSDASGTPRVEKPRQTPGQGSGLPTGSW